MPHEAKIWKVGKDDRPTELNQAVLELESRLEDWIARDISMVSSDLMVIGRQIETEFGGVIDLLCIHRSGDLFVVELKRDKTPREITAQVLDYASWVTDLPRDEVSKIAAEFVTQKSLEMAFRDHFGEELPDSINENHGMLIVASRVDPSSERIIRYLSNGYGININAVTFQFFRTDDGQELLSRVFLLEPDEVDQQTRIKQTSKRLPNLTFEQLSQLAIQRGVADLYNHMVSALKAVLSKGTTRSSIVFSGKFGSSKRAIISLLPGESEAAIGLNFIVFFQRFQQFFELSETKALTLMPPRREPWVYSGGTGDADWTGFRGYFANVEEIDRFLAGFIRGTNSGNP